MGPEQTKLILQRLTATNIKLGETQFIVAELYNCLENGHTPSTYIREKCEEIKRLVDNTINVGAAMDEGL